MNAIIGEKIAIITPKPQTTRNRILGIHTVPERGQIVFIDTPGLHRPQGRFGERLNRVAVHSLHETELALLMVDASLDASKPAGKLSGPNRRAVETVQNAGVPVVCALNKVDRIHPKTRLLPLLETYSKLLGTDNVIPISATKKSGLDLLEDILFELLPESPLLYPEDMLSDQAERFLAAEIIREKLMLFTHNELPYSVVVEVEEWVEEPGKDEKPGQLRISAVIHVEKDSQKGIIIGKGGQKLKEVGTKARIDLESGFSTKVFLQLFVHVEKNWSSDPRRLDRFGY